MSRRAPVAILSAVLIAVRATAFAADATAPSPTGLKFGVSAGAALVTDYEGSDDYEPVPVWNLRVGNLYDPSTYAGIRGLHFESNLLPSENFKLGVTARYLSDYDHVDDDAVSELERPSTAVHVGAIAGYEFTDDRHIEYGIDIEATYDVLHGNGFVITPRTRVQLPVSEQVVLNGFVAASWASDDYMTNRFGISDADAARSGLQPFDADAGVKDVELGVGLTYAFTKHWSFSTSGSYQRMLGDAADSPIVDDRGSKDGFRIAALVNYRF